MKFLNLELENWTSYKGSGHSVDFATTPGSQITVLSAKNGVGKTSILKAFSFVLYGSVNSTIARSTERLRLEDFPSRTALETGAEVLTSVALTFEYQGVEWLLKRQFTAKQGQNVNLLVLGQVQTSLIQVGKGSGISTERIEDFINDNILNQKVSHFYFFDGVLLEEIQSQLTRKDEISRKLVMTSVENALGLRFLDHLNLNLRTCLAKVDSEIAGVQKAARLNEGLLSKINTDQEALDAHQKDIDGIKVLRDGHMKKRDEHDARLLSLDPSTKEKAIERNRLEEELKGLQIEADKAIDAIRREGERAWLSPLASQLQALYNSQEAEAEANRATRTKQAELRVKIASLEASLSAKACSLCGHAHGQAEIDGIKSQVQKLRDELASLPSDSGFDESLSFKIGRANADGQRIDVVRQTVAAHDAILVKIATAKRRIGKIGDELGDVNENIDVSWEEAQRAEAQANVEKCETSIDEISGKMDVLRNALAGNRAKLTDNDSVSKKDQDTRKLLDTICGAIEASFERFRDEMRAQVQEKATEYLSVLTSEPEIYGSVEISSDYQIRIKSPQGKVLQISNAGHKQILTTAFVSAMAAVSTEKTPFVMDTALSHLDNENSRQMLEWAKYVDQQVILLVTPKELPQKVAKEVLGTAIGRNYEIEKIGDEESQIKELN